jgi:hypothetical protein
VHQWDHPVADDEWHHVAHSIIPGKTVHTYIDGVQNGADFDEMSAKKTIVPFEGRELDLGVSLRFNTEFFPGQMDEVVIFDYALSKDEVNQLMKAPLTEQAFSVELTSKATVTWGAIKVGD